MLYLVIIMLCLPIAAYGIITNNNATIDTRTFLKERPQNKQDEQGNTFLHQLALNCSRFDEWKQMSQEMEQFADDNEKNMPHPFKNNMPNPLLENYDRATARRLAKAQFNESGNPICGTLILFLKEAEFMFLDRCSSKEGRKALAEKK